MMIKSWRLRTGRPSWRPIGVLLLALALAGCCTVFRGTPPYDPAPVNVLTALQSAVEAAYVSYSEANPDTAAVVTVIASLDSLRMSESGKKCNAETTGQIGKVSEVLRLHITDRRDDGPWQETHESNRLGNAKEAFSVLIDYLNRKAPKTEE